MSGRSGWRGGAEEDSRAFSLHASRFPIGIRNTRFRGDGVNTLGPTGTSARALIAGREISWLPSRRAPSDRLQTRKDFVAFDTFMLGDGAKDRTQRSKSDGHLSRSSQVFSESIFNAPAKGEPRRRRLWR